MALARLGDPVVSGFIIQATGPTVNQCQMATHLQGDLHLVIQGDDVCIAPLIQGSPKVFMQFRACGRVGDLDACGSVILAGCPTVLAG